MNTKMKCVVLSAAVAVLGAAGAWAETVKYRAYDAEKGQFYDAEADCMIVKEDTRTLTNGWYAVKGDVALPQNSHITVSGSAHLILCDGAKLTIEKVEEWFAALTVESGNTQTNSLVIYGQTDGTGALEVTGGYFCSGIGGGHHGTGGEVTINGGMVTANGGYWAAGIGGGADGDGGAITINGGSVTVNGGTYGAGIGGGVRGTGGAITINGGTVTANGGYEGAGIGGGDEGAGGKVTINGGTVTAQGDKWGAGIGVGMDGVGGEVRINGGTVTATGGEKGAGIGVGMNDDDGTVTIDGGSVKASSITGQPKNSNGDRVHRVNVSLLHGMDVSTPIAIAGLDGYGTTDIYPLDGNKIYLHLPNEEYAFTVNGSGYTALVDGGTMMAKPDDLTCDVGTISAVDADKTWLVTPDEGVSEAVISGLPEGDLIVVPPTIGRVEGVPDGQIRVWDQLVDVTDRYAIEDGVIKFMATVTVGLRQNIIAFWTSGDGGEMNEVVGGSFVITQGVKFKVIFTVADGYRLDGPTDYESIGPDHDVVLTDEQVPVARTAPVEYVDADGVLRTNDTYSIVTAGTDVFLGGWYLVTGAVLRAGIDIPAGLTMNLILADDASLKVTGANNCAGIDVQEGDTLNIYGQTGGTGVLEANGGYYSAGIGSGAQGVGGVVTINGGRVTANGGAYSAGIGGGRWGVGGTVTINGGTVTANGSDGGAGIGGGVLGDGGEVTINGGMVTANGDTGGAGIGGGGSSGGNGGAGGIVTINGGTVTANGSDWVGCSAGIGGGNIGAGGTVEINGGRVTANGGKDEYGSGASIGCGDGGEDGTVSITGGIFGMKINDSWCADGYGVFDNPDPDTNGSYPYTVLLMVKVTVGTLEHMTAAWTSDDGVTNALDGDMTFEVPKGTTGVKVVFTPEDRYGLDKTEYAFTGPITEDCAIPAADLPTATYLYAKVTVGKLPDHVVSAAWTSDDGVTNVVNGETFEVLKGTTGVKVVFTPEDGYGLDKPECVLASPLNADYTLTDGDLPTAEYLYAVVTVGTLEHMTAAWTSDDGVTNVVNGETFEVLKGTANLKVIFTIDPAYELASGDLVCLFESVDNDVDVALPKIDHRKVEYVDADGKVQTNDTFSVVTAATDKFTDGWYLVEGDIERPGIDVQAGCEAHLILADGASLKMTGGNECAGIDVRPGETLNIYGQTGGTGRLAATGDWFCAGIGGGDEGAGGKVTINGGTVTANGGKHYGAGIGGGCWGSGGNVTINGGRIKIAAGAGAAVIGRGSGGNDDGEVAITGGLFGMEVEESWLAPGYSVAYNLDPETRADYPWIVLPSESVATVTVGEYRHMTVTWTYGDGTVTNALAGTAFAIEKGTQNVAVLFKAKPGYSIKDESDVDLGVVVGDVTFGEDGVPFFVPGTIFVYGDIIYQGWDDEGQTQTVATVSVADYTLVTSETTELGDGFYVVAEDAVIDNGGHITVNGSAHLILCDDASLIVTNVEYSAAIEVTENSRLAIYGQQDGTGHLWVTGGNSGAGIGSGYYGSCEAVTINGGTVTAIGGTEGAGIGSGKRGVGGVVTINGGRVTANGGEDGAGIGSGYLGSCGMVTIKNGTVTAIGGWGSAGIGSGYYGSCEAVTINGGTVTANGGEEGAGIGSSEWGNCDVVTINDGTVTAIGGTEGAGIGRGWMGTGGKVTINNGTVMATGGEKGAGIGGGLDGAGGDVSINGGMVTATGSNGGAGIGGGLYGAGGFVRINGGTVTATGSNGGAGIGGGFEGGWDGAMIWDREKVRIDDGDVGSGYQYVKFVEIGITWPEDPTVVEGKSAAEAYRIPATAKLAEADAGAIATWAKANSVTPDSFAAAPDDYEEAFLLNCALDKAETEAAEYRITGISQNADGAWEVAVRTENTAGRPYYGRSVIQCFTDAACTVPAEEDDPAALFIRAYLRVLPAGEVPSDHHGIVVPGPVRIVPVR